MQHNSDHIAYLWRQYLAGNASKEELDELLALNSNLDDEQQSAILEQLLSESASTVKMETDVQENMLQGILKTETPVINTKLLLRRYWIAAASVLLLLAIGAYWFINTKNTHQPLAEKMETIQPGRSGALLTLADGTQIILDTIQKSNIPLQGAANAKVENGTLVYEQGSGYEIAYNVMNTPKGRQYQLTLADNTKVWLNASSSIRFPTTFSGNERLVEITGEAYFEVAQHKNSPFRVKVNNRAEVEVLGTSFNVNAYANEDMLSTTLLQGAVRVHDVSAEAVVLKPGQQAQIKTGQHITLQQAADIEKVMAWKNGLFNFEGATLREVMKQLERWYEIDVVYEGNVPDIVFGGMLSKGLTLNELLDILKTLQGKDLEFRLDKGRNLVISQVKRS